MTFLTRLLWRFLYLCALLFVSLSVVYTTGFLFSVTPSGRLGTLSDSDSSISIAGFRRAMSDHREQGDSVANWEKNVNVSQLALPPVARKGLANSAPTFGWTSSEFTLRYGLGHPGTYMVDEKTMLSKTFASSMRPSNVIPYFYRASGTFKRDDITITTLVTSNRFEVLARLVKKYKGPLDFASFLALSTRNSSFRANLGHRPHQGHQTARQRNSQLFA